MFSKRAVYHLKAMGINRQYDCTMTDPVDWDERRSVVLLIRGHRGTRPTGC
jgi:hypothetical protein